MENSAKPSMPSTVDSSPRPLRGMEFIKNYGVLFFFLLLIVLNALFTPNFFDAGTLDKTLRQVVLEEGLLSEGDLDRLLDFRAMTEPGIRQG